jgi:hypothetical protein
MAGMAARVEMPVRVEMQVLVGLAEAAAEAVLAGVCT